MDMSLLASIVLFLTLIVLLFFGIPISVSVAVSSILTMFLFLPPDMVLFTAAQKIMGGMDSFALLALPFFILSGNLMNKGGIAIRLVNLAKLMGGRLPGYLAHTNVIANMLFGAISGSASAATAAVGGIMAPIQKREGYDPAFSSAINIASGPTGLLIPPSGAMIVYSMTAGGVSVASLFIAGYIPGILMGFSVMIYAYIFSKKNKYLAAEKINNKLKVIVDSFPALLLIIIVIGGITIGIFTATEGAGVAALYSLILSILYKELTFKGFLKILISSMQTTGMILFLIGSSTIMSYVMAYTGIPEAISSLITSISQNKYVVLFIINVILLFIGTFMDLTPAILIFTPIFLPMVTRYGNIPHSFWGFHDDKFMHWTNDSSSWSSFICRMLGV